MGKLIFLVPLLFVLGLPAGENANRDKKALPLQLGDNHLATARLQHLPSRDATAPEASITREASSAEYPFLVWNTFLGSSASDSGYSIAVDDAGNIYVAGTSTAAWGSPLRAFAGGTDAFVARLDADGRLIWNTFLGGRGNESVRTIRTDASGNVYLLGSGSSGWGAPLRPFSGSTDAFVARLDRNGAFQWNTFLGSATSDSGCDMVVSKNGYAAVIGTSDSSWGSPLRPYKGKRDAFIACITPSGGLLWNTFYWGPDYDSARSIGIDPQGHFLANGTFDPMDNCGDRGFFVRLNTSGDVLWDYFPTNWPYVLWGGAGMTFDSSGDFYVYVNCYGMDDYSSTGVNKYDGNGKCLWGADLEGDMHPYESTSTWDIDIDDSGHLFAAGETENGCAWLPLNTLHGGIDAIVSLVIPPDPLPKYGEFPPVWHMFLGGSGDDVGTGIAWHGGNVYVVGRSTASWGSPGTPFHGGQDMFVAKLKPELTAPPLPPQAVIHGPDVAYLPPIYVQLDGSYSKVSSGYVAANSWGLQAPSGSQAQMTPSGPYASFTADIPGDYIVSLQVKDNRGAWSPVTYHTVKAVAYGPSGPPLARISGPLTACRPPQLVGFNGRDSNSPNGAVSGYYWGLQAPAGSQAKLSANGASATFTADIPGTFVVSLKIKDSRNAWSPVTYHTLRATAGDPPGLAMQGIRKEVQAWLIRREYAKLTMTVMPDPGCPMIIPVYRLHRRQGQGAWVTVREMAPSAFTESNGVLTLSLIDKYLELKTAYSYRLAALDADSKEAAATEITL
jgi:hypothetical protein